MIKLPTEFVSGEGGFSASPLTYKQVSRTDKVAVYERSLDGNIRDYEVFFVKIIPKGTIQKFPNNVTKLIEDDIEKYPSTGQFGRIAWSVSGPHAKSCALKKFETLNQSLVVATDDPDDEPPTLPIIEIDHSPSVTVSNSEPKHRGRAPKERSPLNLPIGNFSTNDLADFNHVSYPDAVFFIKQELNKTIKFIGEERRHAKGKPTNIYSKI